MTSDDQPAAQPDAPEFIAERAVVVLGFLIVEGWCSSRELPDRVRATPDWGCPPREFTAARSVRTSRPDVGQALDHLKLDPAFTTFGFITVFDLSLDQWRDLDDDRVLECGLGDRWSAILEPVRTIGRSGAPDPVGRALVERAIEAGLIADRTRIELFRAVGRGDDAPLFGDARIERGALGDLAIGVEFWVPDAIHRAVVVANEDLTWMAAAGELLVVPRRDVTDHLHGTGRRVRGDGHGVLAVVPSGRRRPLRVTVGAVDDAGALVSRVLDVAGEGDVASFADRLLSRIGLTEDQAVGLLAPLMAEHRPASAWQVEQWGDRHGASTAISVVVIIRSDLFFLHSILHMQAALGAVGEWVLVCEDPALAAEARAVLSSRSHAVRAGLKLVWSARRQGHGRAAAAGAAEASGDLLLFMDAAVWLDTAAALDAAAASIRAGLFGLVGFRLLFEDGTVQHDGVRIGRRTPGPSGLALEHPGKGLPPGTVEAAIVPTESVTGALMLVSRRLYDAVGGFADGYREAAAAAADFCLRVRSRGDAIGLCRLGPVYHVEAADGARPENPRTRAGALMDRALLHRTWMDDCAMPVL